MAFSSYLTPNPNLMASKTEIRDLFGHEAVYNPLIANSLTYTLNNDSKCNLLNGFISGSFDPGNYFSSNCSNDDPVSELHKSFDSVNEYYNPWSHRVLLQARQPAKADNREFNKFSGASLIMSPGAANLDALVSKLIAEDDVKSDIIKGNFANYNESEDTIARAAPPRNRLPQSSGSSNWPIKGNAYNEFTPQSSVRESNQQLELETLVSRMNTGTSSLRKMDEIGANYRFNSNNCGLPSEKIVQHEVQPVAEGGAAQNGCKMHSQAEASALFDYQSSFDTAPTYQKLANVKQSVLMQPQQQAHLVSTRQPSENNRSQTQIRSIRAAARNSYVAPMNDLNYRIERCYEQFRYLEKERTKLEQELIMKLPGKKISSTNNLPVPRLPQNCSKLDRLIVDQLREHAKVITLIALMEQLQGSREMHPKIHATLQRWLESIHELQFQRKDSYLNGPKTRMNNIAEDMCDFICSQISLAVHELCAKIRSARSALWCASVSFFHDSVDYDATPSSNGNGGGGGGSDGAPALLFPQ